VLAKFTAIGYNITLMTERKGATPDTSKKSGEIKVIPNQKGLVGLYLKAREDAERQAVMAQIYKDAIIVKSDGLASAYRVLIEAMFSNDAGTNFEHPVASNRRHLNKPKKSTRTYDKQLISEDGKQKRRVVFKQIKSGDKIEMEVVRLEHSDSPVRYISLNLLTKEFEMRDSTSMQTLGRNEPRIISLTGETNPQAHSDILDTFTDELKFLKSAKVA
jgi:hypothetical protein